MMKQIMDLGNIAGDTGGCTVCHGGNPEDGSVKGAHMGAPKSHAGGLATFIKSKQVDALYISDVAENDPAVIGSGLLKTDND